MTRMQVALIGALALAMVIAALVLWTYAAVGAGLRKARRARVRVGFMDAMAMRFRSSRAAEVLEAAATAKAGGLGLTLTELETHSLAGGDVGACVEAMIEARRRGIRADWLGVYACDLAGRDVRAIVAAGLDPDQVLGKAEYGDRFAKAGRSGR